MWDYSLGIVRFPSVLSYRLLWNFICKKKNEKKEKKVEAIAYDFFHSLKKSKRNSTDTIKKIWEKTYKKPSVSFSSQKEKCNSSCVCSEKNVKSHSFLFPRFSKVSDAAKMEKKVSPFPKQAVNCVSEEVSFKQYPLEKIMFTMQSFFQKDLFN